VFRVSWELNLVSAGGRWEYTYPKRNLILIVVAPAITTLDNCCKSDFAAIATTANEAADFVYSAVHSLHYIFEIVMAYS
jgi:hypothetical protein